MSVIREPDAEPIPGYRLIGPLGSGGFGEVWKCEAPGGIFKAIKIVYGNLNSLDSQGVRAEQELSSLQRIKEVRHPFILSMDRIEIVEGELVIVMELADKSLHDAFNECTAAGLIGVPRDDVLRYLRDAAEALDHMIEKHNLLHLDVKPRNLFLISDRVKVADFGLVKHLERQSGLLGGVTPLYAPPETFTGKISPHSDQYSLAIVYQELVTGQRPFTGKNPRQLAQQHLQAEPELRSLPEVERPVVARALSKDPTKRFPSCMAFIRALFMAQMEYAHTAPPAASQPGSSRPKTISDTLEDINLGNPGRPSVVPAAPAAKPEALPSSEDGWQALPEPDPAGVSRLGITVAQPTTGSLRPTLILGLGSFGRRAMLELRCRFLDRFGDLSRLPLLRFLYIDTDGDALKASTQGASDVALQPNEVYHLPLQAPSHYRKRQIDQMCDWLPREKLHSLPRNLKTQGSRALGRLAFADNYMRLLARLKREVQQVTHPDAIYQSVSQTGLALRDNVPRVYVIGSATGGSSGYLADLGYAMRRLLQQLRHPEGPITSWVLCGAPDDPATPPEEAANVYATLTELNHFADPTVPFTGHYGTDGPRLVDEAAPFDATYLLAMPDRAPESRRDTVAHLGSYLFHEMTTPLGLRLDQARQLPPPPSQIPFRSFGTHAVWFPRGLLLRLAARTACRRILDDWQALDTQSGYHGVPAGPDPQLEIEALCAKVLSDPGLRGDALARQLEEKATTALEGSPAEALARLLSTLEEQAQHSSGEDDQGNWARQANRRVQEWLGPGLPVPGQTVTAGRPSEWRKSKLSRSLEVAAGQIAEEWEARLTEAAMTLMDSPGRRVATAECGLRQLLAGCAEALAAQTAALEQGVRRLQQAEQQLHQAMEQCAAGGGGGGSLFSSLFFGGNRNRRFLRVFLDHLGAFARLCLAQDVACAVGLFWTRLQGRVNDRLRDMAFCRARLRGLQDALEIEGVSWGEEAAPSFTAAPEPGEHSPGSPAPSTASYWEEMCRSSTTQVILPGYDTLLGNDPAIHDLGEVADRFLSRLTAEQWSLLDLALQERVLAARGGLHKVCLGSADLSQHLLKPLLEQTASCLGEHLPITDVAQLLIYGADGQGEPGDGAALPEDFADRVQSYFERAAPLVGPHPPGGLSRAGAGSGSGGSDAGVTPSVARRRPVSGSMGDGAETPEVEHSFLLIPASDAGTAFGEEANRLRAEVQLVRVPGQNALLFCREQGSLSPDDLQRFLRACRGPYEELAASPATSPHARQDITDWLPLDP